MTYQDMVDTLVAMNEQQRHLAIQNYWQAVLSDGFIAFVQGQLEAFRKVALSESGVAELFGGIDPSLIPVLKQQAGKRLERLVALWDSMATVYQMLQKQSEREGHPQGMVAHGRHRAMPRGVSVTAAVQCYRCGSPAVNQGLCSGCLDTHEDWEQEDLEYDRQREDLEYQRQQDDQLYYDNQQDFNTYTDYYTEY